MNRTGSNLLRRSMAFVACFFLALSAVSGQEVDVAVRSMDEASPAVAVDYASIIRFSSSREAAAEFSESSAESTDTESTDTESTDTESSGESSEAESSHEFVASTAEVEEVELAEASTPVAATSGVGSGVATLSPPNRTEVSRVISEVEEAPAVESIVEELRRRTERPALSQGMRSSRHIERWEVPKTWSLGSAEVEWPEWVLEGTDLYVEEAPAYAEIAPLPLFYVHPPMETELKRKMKKLVRKKLFREIRRHTKRRWRKLFKDSPTMRFSTYEETLAKINHIGKGGDMVDVFNNDYSINEAKDHVFQRESRRGEADIPLFTWGPVTVTDTGELRFDMGTAAASDIEEVVIESVEVGGKKAKPLFSGKDYKLSTSLSLHVNDDFTGGENYLPFLSSYGVDVEIEWLSDILGREMVGAEFEVEFDDDGDVAAFFNFVIKSRR